jgi:hypothetical protein
VGSSLYGLQGREDQLSNDHPFLRQDIVEVLADRVRLDGLDRLSLSPSFECGSHASRPVFEMARHDSHRKDFRQLAFVTGLGPAFFLDQLRELGHRQGDVNWIF